MFAMLRIALLAFTAFALLTACAESQPPPDAPVATAAAVSAASERICPRVIGTPTCLVRSQKYVQPACVGSECGWAPKDLQTRYKLPISKGSGQVVAVVDVYDQPNASSDLATYRAQFGLGTASFEKYNQNGQQGNYPQSCTVSSTWCVQEDLDIEMVSATCPKCTIYLVEANSGATGDLDAAEEQAVTLGAHIVSNGWICYGSLTCVDKTAFEKKGVTYLAAGGDANETGAPAAFDTVAAIGGTQLEKNGSQYSEIVSGPSGGCATGVKKPAWQRDTFCAYRLANDAAAEAGCSPGVAEYDSNEAGWFDACGTSVAAPLLAGVFGLAGNATRQEGGRTFWRRAHHKYLYPIAEGHGGECAYRKGRYNTCAGWGSPNGIGAF